MDTYLNRGNAVLCTLLGCLTLAAFGNYYSIFLLPSNPTGEVSYVELYEFGHNQALQSEQAQFGLNIKADLKSCFNWNTKQLFVYVVAKYKTQKNTRNEVIIWDRIMKRPEDATLNLVNEITKYPLRDYGRSLRNRNVDLHLEFVYHPIVGVMKTKSIASSTFTLPSTYYGYRRARGTGRTSRSSQASIAYEDMDDAE